MLEALFPCVIQLDALTSPCLQCAAASSHPRPAAGADLSVRPGDAAPRLHVGLGRRQRLCLREAQPGVRGPNLRPVWKLQRGRPGRPEDELRCDHTAGASCLGYCSYNVSECSV